MKNDSPSRDHAPGIGSVASGQSDRPISEMHRRVAVALCCTAAGCRKGEGPYAICQIGSFLDDAERVIRAMREPTKPMVDRAWALIGSNLRYEEAYRHIVDAALSTAPQNAGEGSREDLKDGIPPPPKIAEETGG